MKIRFKFNGIILIISFYNNKHVRVVKHKTYKYPKLLFHLFWMRLVYAYLRSFVHSIFPRQECCLNNNNLIGLMYPFLFAIDKEISYSDLKTLLKKGSGIVVDVRSKDEVDKGRISGSIHIPGQRETE